jgi:ATP-dependent DNA helicase Rep
LISNWKSALVSPDQARKDAQNDTELLAANAFASYSATLQAYQAVDFDDLIALPVALFENHPEVREKWQNRLRYLLIDEYQDTNTSQYRCSSYSSGRAPRLLRSATTIRRSMAGAAPTSRTCAGCRATIRSSS